MNLEPGSKVDRYVLVERLGAGGQGAVYRAQDPLDPEHPRALKLVDVSEVRPTDLERVRREARVLAKLDHPSLVKCHGLFEDLNHGLLGMSMDFVLGTSARNARKDPRFTPQHAAWLLTHLAAALAFLHEKSLVHRDIKLDNVVVAERFFAEPETALHVKLVDFGIAMFPGALQTLTALGALIGTLSYLAPEQLEPSLFGDEASSTKLDVFAFGVLGWQLFAGEHPTGLPRKANIVDYAAAYRRAAEASTWPPAITSDPWLELLRDCLKVRAKERIANGAALSLRCNALLGIESGSLNQPQTSAPSPQPVNGPPSAMPHTVVSQGVECDVVAPTVLDARAPEPGALPLPLAPPSSAFANDPEIAELPPTPHLVPTARARKNSTLLLALVSGAAVLVGFFGFIAYSQSTTANESPSPSSNPLSARNIAPQSTARTTKLPERFVPKDCAESDKLCTCCPSGHDCLGIACEEPLSFEGFRLRVGHVQVSGEADEDTRSLHERADARLCVANRRLGERCMPLSAGPNSEGRVYLTTQDLTQETLELRVQVDSYSPVPIAVGKFTANASGGTAKIQRAVLCKGLTITMSDGILERLVLFLDPATEGLPPPEVCAPPREAPKPEAPEPELSKPPTPDTNSAEADRAPAQP